MVWLFDYDLTLYGTEERCVINSLDHRISLFVQKTVGGDFESAHKVRTDYLERFGTTLAGLMAMNNTDPDVFFDFIHEPEYLIYPKKSPEKLALLQSLKGPHFVFTNGRRFGDRIFCIGNLLLKASQFVLALDFFLLESLAILIHLIQTTPLFLKTDNLFFQIIFLVLQSVYSGRELLFLVLQRLFIT